MAAWKYRIVAVLLGLLGAGLIAVVWRAMYFTDAGAQKLMFEIGIPLMLLTTLAGALLLGAACFLFAFADHWRLRRA